MSALLAMPRLVIELDGVELRAEDAAALSAARVRQVLSRPAVCELTFAAPAGPLARAADLAGAPLSLAADGAPLFVGEVTAVEHAYGPAGGHRVFVRGCDRLHRLRQRQPLAVHVEVTPADLARELAAGLGLAVSAASEGPLLTRLFQAGASDLGLLREACERAGLFFTLRGDTLHLLTLEGEGEPVPLELGRSLREARFAVETDGACRGVEALGWDAVSAEPLSGRAGRPRSGRSVPASASPERVGGDGARWLPGALLASGREAEALAQAELDRRVAAEVVMTGVAAGDPRLAPGVRVVVAGVTPALAGRYVLAVVTHTVDPERGYLAEFSTAPPEPLPRPAASTPASLALGRVSRVDDPRGAGRVCAELPAQGGLETDWLEVLCPGAGPAKGLVALPDVDDRVLLLAPGADFAQAVVLGGFYGATGPPDAGVEGGRVERFTFTTAAGQRVALDGAGRRVWIEDGAGSSIELGPEKVTLHAAADLTLEAPGRRLVLRAERIDFERG